MMQESEKSLSFLYLNKKNKILLKTIYIVFYDSKNMIYFEFPI